MDSTQQTALFQQFREILPADAIVTSKERLRPYECDGLIRHRALPLAVLLPNTLEQVQLLVKTCARFKVPIVTRGAGTGLSGGTRPHQDGVVLSLNRLTQIAEIDPDKRQARVQAGVTTRAISQAVAVHGLFYAPDPASQASCSIGGNLATNAAGAHSLKYGLTLHNVLAATIVSPQGDIIELGSNCLDTAGYDLLALLSGSEGSLGIVVEVLVKLSVKPASQQLLLAAFDDISLATQAALKILARGVLPSALELIDQISTQIAAIATPAGFSSPNAAILLCELDGNEDAVQAEVALVKHICQQQRATQLYRAKNTHERKNFWAGYNKIIPAAGMISADYYLNDSSLPASALHTTLTKIRQLSAHYELEVAHTFRVGMGNLQSLILYDAHKTGEAEKAHAFAADILELCVKVGGSITGEHGVGHERLEAMCMQFSDSELALLHAVKHAFDPDNLLNPGAALPNLPQCVELGTVQVHHEELTHPD